MGFSGADNPSSPKDGDTRVAGPEDDQYNERQRGIIGFTG
jgi:hypothetical protein